MNGRDIEGMRTLRRWLLLTLALLWVQPAQAQMAIDRLWVDFTDESVGRSDLVVRNESEDVYYVTVTPSEILNPGQADEERVTYTDPEELGLLVTPNRLVLQPGDMRAIRLVSLNQNLQTDRNYRVDVRPELGEISVTGGNDEDRGMALKLLSAFDVLVTVRPEDGRPEFTARRGPDFLELANRGTSSMVLLDGRLCPAVESGLSETTIAHYTAQLREGTEAEEGEAPAELVRDENGCIDLPSKRLYAGNSWRVHAADTEFLKFDTRWRATQELRRIEVRCGMASPQTNESDFCQPAESVAERGTAVPNSPNQPTEH